MIRRKTFKLGSARARTRSARAAAVVEMAVVLPFLLTILFGVIEFGWTLMNYQSITNAAREGCRVAVLEGSTEVDITARVEEYLTLVGMSDYTIEIVRSDASSAAETVTVRVPYSSISLLGGYLGGEFDIVGRAAMRKEGWTE